MADLDSLHALVSGAIWRAEKLVEAGAEPGAAWREVSILEERLAGALPAGGSEGRIARRGAVRAALKAGDYRRARELAARFAAEPDASAELSAKLEEMLDEDSARLARSFRFAAKHHRVADARAVALRLQAGGAFGLAAA
jgi:hypothetical protein